MTQNTDWGIDLRTVSDGHGNVDLTPGMLESSGRAVLAERLIRRQTTRRGSVIDAPNECFDVKDWLSKEFNPKTLSQLQGTIVQELKNDVGVLQCTVSVDHAIATKTLTIVEKIVSSAGPFTLTMKVGPDLFEALVTDT